MNKLFFDKSEYESHFYKTWTSYDWLWSVTYSKMFNSKLYSSHFDKALEVLAV